MSKYGSLRASDSDREHVADRLRQAAAEGRLVAEELEQRMATALRARTYGELDDVVSDLPGERVARTRRSRSLRSLPVPPLALVVVIPVVFALVVAVLAVVLALVTAWATLAAIVWLVMGHHRRRYYGPRLVRPGRPVGMCARANRRPAGSFTPWL
jgi:Flp pilus assembly protein TadB